MFKAETMEDGQLEVENVGEEKEYELVLNLSQISQSSWISLWGILALFGILNALLFWCHYKKNVNVHSDDIFDESPQV